VKAIVLDSGDHVLRVRGADRPTWELPMGRVGDGETVEAAVRRMLGSDLAITLEGAPLFIGLEPNGAAEPEGHIAGAVNAQVTGVRRRVRGTCHHLVITSDDKGIRKARRCWAFRGFFGL
jgi:hypothetical protein